MDEHVKLLEAYASGHRLAASFTASAHQYAEQDGYTSDKYHACLRNAEHFEGKAEGILCALVSLDMVTVD